MKLLKVYFRYGKREDGYNELKEADINSVIFVKCEGTGEKGFWQFNSERCLSLFKDAGL